MISAWDVYWVMQLDSILFTCSAVFFFGWVGCLGLWFLADNEASPRYLAVIATALWFLAGAVGTFLPSSKTAAAMIVLPAITSDSVVDVVKPEARELYELAKGALKNLGAKEEAVEKKTDEPSAPPSANADSEGVR